MLNDVKLIGRIGHIQKDIGKSGNKYARVSLAVTENYKKGGDWVEKTNWIPVTFFGETASRILPEHVGNLVFVQGSLNKSTWTTEDGQQRSELQVIGRSIKTILRKDQSKSSGPRVLGEDLPQEPHASQVDYDLDDEIPF